MYYVFQNSIFMFKFDEKLISDLLCFHVFYIKIEFCG